MMLKVQFTSKASGYLELKGLNIETWINGVKEGKKGVVLAPYGLNMLLESATWKMAKSGQPCIVKDWLMMTS